MIWILFCEVCREKFKQIPGSDPWFQFVEIKQIRDSGWAAPHQINILRSGAVEPYVKRLTERTDFLIELQI
jgi:hypothetical protein